MLPGVPAMLPRVFGTLRALRRDLAAVAASLAGRPAGPVATTTKPSRTPGPAPAPSLHAPRRVRVARVVRETADAVTLVLEDPSGAPLRFAAGQFFTLHVPVDGEVVKRAYSASSSALQPGSASVTVKRVGDGRVSRRLVDHAREGDALELLGPSGSFTPPAATAPRRLVLVGGGSGITPLASIARTLLASEPGTRLALVYGNRALDDVIFREALDALAVEHAPRFVVRHVLERPPPGWTGGAGLLDGGALARELDALGEPDAQTTEYYLCGPAPMMSGARACLEERGVAPARIHEERFVSAHAASPLAGSEPQPVKVHVGGRVRELVVAPGRTVLEAALDAGVDMPFSCAVGGCGTCLVRLTAGRVAMDEPNCLSDQERAGGYVLACVSRPSSPCSFEVP
jgi:ring-1,2-phenylacetyl-CoA epoxidase subunit PaaE